VFFAYITKTGFPMQATLQSFATNINCGSCVRSVTSFLDELDGVTIWRVDVEDERKVLSVEGTASRADIVRVVEEAGYDIRPLEATV
jgi:copper chaperone CopZ